ncbi:MAG: histidine kinase [Chitinophagaceae bacterium]
MDTSVVASIKKPKPRVQLAKWLTTTWQRSFTDMRYRILLHASFWLFLVFFWLRESLIVHIEPHQPLTITLTGIALSLFLFYPLVYGIIPLLQKGKWIAALLAFIAYYIIAIFLRTYHIDMLVNNYGDWFAGQDFWSNFYKHQLEPVQLLKGFFSSITGLITIIYIPLTLKFIRYAYNRQLKQTQLEKENVQLELNFLKAQVNPHLLFNSLNNLQSYIVHDEKEKSILLLNRLADLLRFSLYECEGEYVSIQQETALLNNYIAVESVRYDEDSEITADIQATTLSYPLPALLLMPLIENAFKYSSALPASVVRIRLTTINDTLQLEVYNTCAAERTTNGGIGLQNVRRRLERYFPGRHQLNIHDAGNSFTVNLIIYPPAV